MQRSPRHESRNVRGGFVSTVQQRRLYPTVTMCGALLCGAACAGAEAPASSTREFAAVRQPLDSDRGGEDACVRVTQTMPSGAAIVSGEFAGGGSGGDLWCADLDSVDRIGTGDEVLIVRGDRVVASFVVQEVHGRRVVGVPKLMRLSPQLGDSVIALVPVPLDFGADVSTDERARSRR